MKSYVFDTEGDGLFHDATRFHVFCYQRLETGEVFVFREHEYQDALDLMSEADLLIGHNIIDHDLPVLEKIYPGWTTKARIRDTLVLCRLLFSNISESDYDLFNRGMFPGKLIGRHSLKAWGFRLGLEKSEFGEDDQEAWLEWSQGMEDRCITDVDINVKLWVHVEEKINNRRHPYPEEPIILEHRFADLVSRMEKNGFPFNEEKAWRLYHQLSERRDEIQHVLKEQYGFWWQPVKVKAGMALWEPGCSQEEVPKRTVNFKDPTRPGREANAPFCPIKRVDFNPGSRLQIVDRLQKLYGWQPTEFTGTGRPSLSKKVLDELIGLEEEDTDELELAVKKIPEASNLAEFFLVQKRIGQIHDGDNGWLKLVRDGKIHGRVNSCGAKTRRVTHSRPNASQTPSASKEVPYGFDFRSCWTSAEGWTQFGCDLSSIEARLVGHLLAEFDGGYYAKELVEGDIHTKNMEVFGVNNRKIAKAVLYALLYGASPRKLGIMTGLGPDAGRRMVNNFMKATPAYVKIIRKLKAEHERNRGWIAAIDGGHLYEPFEHKLLNTKIQSACAIIAKAWCLEIDDRLTDLGFNHSWDGDYVFVGFFHDEIQTNMRGNAVIDAAHSVVKDAIRSVEQQFNIQCPLDCEAKTGNNWAECH